MVNWCGICKKVQPEVEIAKINQIANLNFLHGCLSEKYSFFLFVHNFLILSFIFCAVFLFCNIFDYFNPYKLFDTMSSNELHFSGLIWLASRCFSLPDTLSLINLLVRSRFSWQFIAAYPFWYSLFNNWIAIMMSFVLFLKSWQGKDNRGNVRR